MDKSCTNRPKEWKPGIAQYRTDCMGSSTGRAELVMLVKLNRSTIRYLSII